MLGDIDHNNEKNIVRWSRKLYATNLITHFGAAKIWPRPSPHSFIEQYVLTTHSYIEQYVLN
jgi:hypothetical protein